MGISQNPSPAHLYPQALQLKLYQAFIFSVPILFSIILFLLFYLFYLKRRRDSNNSSYQPETLPRSLNQATSLVPLPFEEDLKEELKEKLPIIMFSEDLSAKDSQCCVCLGDFELDEQLNQIPSCQHMFHIDCIRHWLQANFTCPLCRCSILPTKNPDSEPPAPTDLLQPSDLNSNHHPQSASLEQEQNGVAGRISLNLDNILREEDSSQIEGSTSGRTCLTESGNSSEPSVSKEGEADYSLRNSVVIQIQMHGS